MAAPCKILVCRGQGTSSVVQVIHCSCTDSEVMDIDCGRTLSRSLMRRATAFSHVSRSNIMVPQHTALALCRLQKHIRRKTTPQHIHQLTSKSEMDKVNSFSDL